jgi:hypothetical protein
VDAVESTVGSFLALHPDNPIAETGVLSELSHHGLASRTGQKRADRAHQPLDILLVAAPWVVAGGAAYAILKRVARRSGRQA